MLLLPSTKPITTETISRKCSALSPQHRFSSIRVELRSHNTKTVAVTATNKGTQPMLATTRRPLVLSLLTTFFNMLEDTINSFSKAPLPPFIDPQCVLCDNFAPVDELPPTECQVIEGQLPSCLNGAYIRNGPNPQYFPTGSYHQFDGDGMLHALTISGGRAMLCSRFVKTYKYNLEHESGQPVFPNMFAVFYRPTTFVITSILFTAARIFSGQINPARGAGLANTSLAFFGDRLFALAESDLPYTVRVDKAGDIETIGRYDSNGELLQNMTAHPKIDLNTKQTFAFRYGMMRPFLTFFSFDANGSKQSDVPIFSVSHQSLVHDFAITERFAIFPEIQITVNPMAIMKGTPLMQLDHSKVPRIGVIPRNAKDESEMRWFDVPGFNIFHTINAWEEEDDVVVLIAPNMLSIEHCLEKTELNHSSVEKVRIDLKRGIVSRFPLSARNLDFGVINPALVGKKSQYAYLGVGEPMPKMAGVVKLDLSGWEHQEHVVASRMYGQGCYGGEPFFVAKNPEDPNAEEDDGYMVSYVHDEILGESKFLVMDAKSPTLEIVAVVKLPRRVPYGFHGLFVRQSDLNKL
ncbi:probable carotenoid cleavage dioxygenase 4, chloroplastic [Macadamia integrifolia]|uniref:probable carotenoid cleavage dioxygenase 4, chloroplastic n=1 Tax=Macadamia integrifolia TaxID=60698 RepID=UPI001C4EE849|nr:probable carotenoid cleavage dioxygenase 4, chloroplastic [Macadamia integrifolia]